MTARMTLRRIRLFLRDWASEWGVAFDIARMRDCERNGGHQWGPPVKEPIGLMRTCTRCKCGSGVTKTGGTGTTTVYLDTPTVHTNAP